MFCGYVLRIDQPAERFVIFHFTPTTRGTLETGMKVGCFLTVKKKIVSLHVTDQHHGAHARRVAQPAITNHAHVGRIIKGMAYEDKRIHHHDPHKKSAMVVAPHRAIKHEEQQPTEQRQDIFARPPSRYQRQPRDQHQH